MTTYRLVSADFSADRPAYVYDAHTTNVDDAITLAKAHKTKVTECNREALDRYLDQNNARGGLWCASDIPRVYYSVRIMTDIEVQP